jgi:hypothetical protein
MGTVHFKMQQTGKLPYRIHPGKSRPDCLTQHHHHDHYECKDNIGDTLLDIKPMLNSIRCTFLMHSGHTTAASR